MTVRLTLVCAAAPAEQHARFGDTSLDERAIREARAAAGALPAATARYMAPSQRCEQTAQALGWEAVAAEPALRDMDMGNWRGRTVSEVAGSDGAGLAVWMSDPEAAPHGGESVARMCDRVAAWLDAVPADAGRVLAVVEQAVARAAVIHILDAPRRSFWHVDVPPLSTVQATGRNGRWNLRMGGTSPASH